MSEEIRDFCRRYFTEKYLQFGDSPLGVDWKDGESQELRFCFVLDMMQKHWMSLPISVFEVGCGYGAFAGFLRERNIEASYSGIDLVDEMVRDVIRKYPDLKNDIYHGDFRSFNAGRRYDFVVGSGIFNVKGMINEAVFESDIYHMLTRMFEISSKGVIFNMMTPAPGYRDDKLYYPALDRLFKFIYENLSRNVEIVSSFPLWEITVGVFK